MKPFYHYLVVLSLLSWLVVSPSPCAYHPTLGRNHTNNIIQCIDTERDALLQFKHHITNDGGMLASWVPHTNCCNWGGVICSDLTGHVIKLNLPSDDDVKTLQGKVSSSLADLKHLKYLNLSSNDFSGDIPRQLGNLSELTTLDLRHSYSFASNKQTLSWLSRLRKLRYLDLSWANLAGVTNWMTIVNSLSSLRVLHLDYCQLPTNTTIPSSLSYINSSTTIHTISLVDNNLNGSSIFQWLFNLPKITTQLEYFDLSNNAFQLPFPNEFDSFDNLSYLSLSQNKFHGSVFKIVSKLCNLKHLDLGSNNFTDELTNVVDSLVSCNNRALVTLDLSWNGFSGTIPNRISSLSSLRELYLSGNQLKGEINRAIGQLHQLEVLDVSSNFFQDTLTHTLFLNLVNLRELYLSDNPRLVVNITENWVPPFDLDVISLRSCKLGPRFPDWLLSQTNYSILDVSKTGIFDSIPVSFWKTLSASNIQYLNMSHNKFYGTLPNLPVLYLDVVVDLSSNLFEGVVPSELANGVESLYLNDNRFSNISIFCPESFDTSSLETLVLSNNLFSGELPDCWTNFSELTSMHLENNMFSGRFPNLWSSLVYVNLYNNSFSGPFPSAFENCIELVMLNIGHNSFTDHIPSWIGNAASQTLRALILRDNDFRGRIPESVCQLDNLEILDLATNHISGEIPDCIANLTAMQGLENQGSYTPYDDLEIGSTLIVETEVAIVSWKKKVQRFKDTVMWVKLIDLSCNELSGEIPSGISKLNGLGSLDLSRNKLSGNIPFEIGNLTALEVLDLSHNHLTGKIPESLAKVTTLDMVDLSNNNLFGKIPTSTQLQSFDASYYGGNPRLCGTPLPSCSKDRVSSEDLNEEYNTSVQDKNDDFGFFFGLYVSVALGFIVGFWGICGTLFIKTSWRYAYFQFLDNIKDMVL